MSQVLQRLQILLHADTANYRRDLKKAGAETKREMDAIKQSVNSLSGQLKTAFAFLGGATIVSDLIKTSDQMKELTNVVRLNTQSAQEYKTVISELYSIANENLTSIEATTSLYGSSKAALDELGKSQKDVLLFTENITKAMSVGGGSADFTTAQVA